MGKSWVLNESVAVEGIFNTRAGERTHRPAANQNAAEPKGNNSV